jgi:hypothetical protein
MASRASGGQRDPGADGERVLVVLPMRHARFVDAQELGQSSHGQAGRGPQGAERPRRGDAMVDDPARRRLLEPVQVRSRIEGRKLAYADRTLYSDVAS